jgi:hypothetical protein
VTRRGAGKAGNEQYRRPPEESSHGRSPPHRPGAILRPAVRACHPAS